MTQTPINSRLSIIGSQLGTTNIVKLWGCNYSFEAAMPADAATADATFKAAAARGENFARLHHIDLLAKTLGYGPVKLALDAAQRYGVYCVVTLTSEDATPFGDYQYFKKMCLTNDPTNKDAVLALSELDRRITAFFKAVGDHPALLAFEPLNEEAGDPATYGAFVSHVNATSKAAGFKGTALFMNAGVTSAWTSVLPSFGIVSFHGYGDDAREADPLTGTYSTLWAEQPWQWDFTDGADHPRLLGEVGSLFPNPFRLEDEILLCIQAKIQGMTGICWFLSASNKGMLGTGPFLDRYTNKEPMRAAAEFLGRYAFLDPSPVKTASIGRTTTYVTDMVQYRTAGDPWGERQFACVVSADGQPIASSSHLFLTGGGIATPTGYEAIPTQDDGKHLQITNIGTLPFVVSGGGPVRFTNKNAKLKAFYYDPLTMAQTGPAPIQKVTPTDFTVETSGGLLVEVVAG